jgi:hypothetical protein
MTTIHIDNRENPIIGQHWYVLFDLLNSNTQILACWNCVAIICGQNWSLVGEPICNRVSNFSLWPFYNMVIKHSMFDNVYLNCCYEKKTYNTKSLIMRGSFSSQKKHALKIAGYNWLWFFFSFFKFVISKFWLIFL